MGEQRKQATSYRPEVTAALPGLPGALPGVRQGSTFSHPAFFAGDRVSAFAYRDGVVLKLPEERVRQLLGQPGVAPFQMRGRPPIQEWTAPPRDDAAAYRDNLALFQGGDGLRRGAGASPQEGEEQGHRLARGRPMGRVRSRCATAPAAAPAPRGAGRRSLSRWPPPPGGRGWSSPPAPWTPPAS